MGWKQIEEEYAKQDTYLVTNDDFSQQRRLLGYHSKGTEHPVHYIILHHCIFIKYGRSHQATILLPANTT